MIKLLFVCTGNIFRSMTAKKCVLDYLKKNNIKNIQIDSAGTGLIPQEMNSFVKERLEYYDIKINHKPKWLTKKLITSNDLIIAMGTDHQKFIQTKFKLKVPLFNEIAYGKSEGILDFEEVDLRSKEKTNAARKYAYFVVDHLHKSIPKLIKNLDKWV